MMLWVLVFFKKTEFRYTSLLFSHTCLCSLIFVFSFEYFVPAKNDIFKPKKKVWGGLYFFILLRILGAEHTGKVIGVLPFVPYPNLICRVTGRGLDWTNVALDDESIGTQLDTKQAISFMCIYLLSTLSVKGYVHKIFGQKPPKGADQGFMTVAESPMVKRTLASVGIDVDELKKLE